MTRTGRMFRILRRTPAFTALLCMGYVPGPADLPAQQLLDSRVYLMEEIVAADTLLAPASEERIGPERLKMMHPSSAAEVLSGVTGSVVTVGSKNSSEISIRGFDSQSVLVMVDGRPVNEPYYGKIDLSTIGIGDAAIVKVVKGASSVRFGPDAMGGVVNIVTADEEGPPVDVSVVAGDGNTVLGDFVHRGRSRGIGYRLHFGGETTRGFPLSADFAPTSIENGNLRNNSDLRRGDMSLKLLFGPEGNPDWKMTVGGSRMSKGLPSSVTEARYWRFRNWDRTSFDLDGEPVRNTTLRLKTKFYVDRFVNELVDYRNNRYDLSDIYYDSTHDNRSAGLLLSSSYFPGENGLTNLGVQARLDESRRQADTGMDWFINRTATGWVFAEHERTLARDLFIRCGASGSFFSFDSWSRTNASLNPSLSVEWTVLNTMISASVSRASDFPTLNELFSNTSGNPDLDPEWAAKCELSVSRALSRSFRWTVTGFANRVHDMIFRAGKLNRYKNIDRASLDGVEVSGLFAGKSLEFQASGGVLDARDGARARLEYRPEWKGDLSLSWKFSHRARMYVLSRSVGPRKTELGGDLGTYHVQNAELTVFEDRALSASITVKNIFDIDYEEEYGYPMAGRSMTMGIHYRWGGR
jgi:iron complex outermembrane recepter protein